MGEPRSNTIIDRDLGTIAEVSDRADVRGLLSALAATSASLHRATTVSRAILARRQHVGRTCRAH